MRHTAFRPVPSLKRGGNLCVLRTTRLLTFVGVKHHGVSADLVREGLVLRVGKRSEPLSYTCRTLFQTSQVVQKIVSMAVGSPTRNDSTDTQDRTNPASEFDKGRKDEELQGGFDFLARVRSGFYTLEC